MMDTANHSDRLPYAIHTCRKYIITLLTVICLCILLVSYRSQGDNRILFKPPPYMYAGTRDPTLEDLLVNFTDRLSLARQHFINRTISLQNSTFPDLPQVELVVNLRESDFLNLTAPHTWMKFVGLVVPPINRNGRKFPQMVDASTISWQRDPIYSFFIDNINSLCSRIDFSKRNITDCSKHVNMSASEYPARHHDSEMSRYWAAFSAIYSHVIPNAVISPVGHVRAGNVYLVASMCTHPIKTSTENGYVKYPLYDEVLTIAQFYGTFYFHYNVEMLPRIFPYVQFLKDNPSVKIHVPSSSNRRTRALLTMLGLDQSQLVDGSVRSRVVYVPQGSACGMSANPLTLQMMSQFYLDYMNRHFPPITTGAIIFIERSRARRLIQQPEVTTYLENMAAKNNLDFVIFSDKLLPSFEETMKLFRRAVLVVAPHGAGLANMMWTRPPAVVVEILCAGSKPIMCYPFMSQTLGHRHFSIQATSGCNDGLNVNVTRLIEVVTFAMTHYYA